MSIPSFPAAAGGSTRSRAGSTSAHRILAALLVAVIGAALGVMSLGGTAQAASPSAAIVVSPNVTNVASSPIALLSAAALEDYWTPQRMATARPADTKSATPAAKGTTVATTATTGKPVTINPAAGALPSTTETLRAKVTRPYTNRPDRLNGKVFFSSGGNNYVCSGTVVNSNNKDMIDTAGHCVSDGAGHFYSNWVFVPGFSSSSTVCTTAAGCYPYGIWTARRLTTTAEWHNHANLKQDLGYAVLKTLNGRHIVNYLGGEGSTFNRSRAQTFNAFGYPQVAPFNGYDQRVSTSGRLGDDNPTAGSGPLTIRISSNQTGGSSGGGWLIQRSATTGLGYVNGHNSYRYVGGPAANASRMYGPYYGDAALSLFNATKVL